MNSKFSPKPIKKQHKVSPVRIMNNNGRFHIEGIGKWHHYWRDPYHLMLTIPWVGFVSILAGSYVLINAIFGFLYCLQPGSINGAQSRSFYDAFFFSVQTLASIGYGVMSPATFYAHILVTIESIVSLSLIAVFTGLAFARFSRPTSKIIFSDVMIIAPHDGVPTLILRCANKRRNYVLEAQARLFLVRDEITQEGESLRRFYDLKLERDRNPSFALSWSIMHKIDSSSPLYNITPEQLETVQAQFIVSVSGIDDTVAYTITTRQIYSYHDIRWNHRFIDLILKSPQGDRYIDYTYFHHTQPMGQQL
jgi:inward rectifier potassium channel